MCSSLLWNSRPCASSSHVATSSIPFAVAAASAAVALTSTSTFTVSFAAIVVLRTTTGYKVMSWKPLHVMPNSLLVLSMGGSATRTVICVAPSERNIASAARCATSSRPAIGPTGEGTVAISTNFLRHIRRQHRLHAGIQQRIREILQVHGIDLVDAHVQ